MRRDTGVNANYYLGSRHVVRDPTPDSPCYGLVHDTTDTALYFRWWNGSAWSSVAIGGYRRSGGGWPDACIGANSDEVWVTYQTANSTIRRAKVTLTGGWSGTAATVSLLASVNVSATYPASYALHHSSVFLPNQGTSGKILTVVGAYYDPSWGSGKCRAVSLLYDVAANSWSPSYINATTEVYRTLFMRLSQLSEGRYVWWLENIFDTGAADGRYTHAWLYDAVNDSWTKTADIYTGQLGQSASVETACAVDPDDHNRVIAVDTLNGYGTGANKRRALYAVTTDGFATPLNWALLAPDWIADATNDTQAAPSGAVWRSGPVKGAFAPLMQNDGTYYADQGSLGKFVDLSGNVSDLAPTYGTRLTPWASLAQEVVADDLIRLVGLDVADGLMSSLTGTSDLIATETEWNLPTPADPSPRAGRRPLVLYPRYDYSRREV